MFKGSVYNENHAGHGPVSKAQHLQVTVRPHLMSAWTCRERYFGEEPEGTRGTVDLILGIYTSHFTFLADICKAARQTSDSVQGRSGLHVFLAGCSSINAITAESVRCRGVFCTPANACAREIAHIV